jgi:hypothetical protein
MGGFLENDLICHAYFVSNYVSGGAHQAVQATLITGDVVLGGDSSYLLAYQQAVSDLYSGMPPRQAAALHVFYELIISASHMRAPIDAVFTDFLLSKECHALSHPLVGPAGGRVVVAFARFRYRRNEDDPRLPVPENRLPYSSATADTIRSEIDL